MSVPIMAVKKCALLRQIAAGAISVSSTLHDACVAAQSQIYSPTFSKGRIVISQSGSGQAGSFAIGGTDWTQDNIFGVIEEFLQMMDYYDPVLLPDDGTTPATNALRITIAKNIMAGNVPEGVRATQGDFTLLYIPVFGTGLQT